MSELDLFQISEDKKWEEIVIWRKPSLGVETPLLAAATSFKASESDILVGNRLHREVAKKKRAVQLMLISEPLTWGLKSPSATPFLSETAWRAPPRETAFSFNNRTPPTGSLRHGCSSGFLSLCNCYFCHHCLGRSVYLSTKDTILWMKSWLH